MPNTAKKILLIAILVLLVAKPVIAEENVTELRIESITTPIEAGGRLMFSFSAGNKAGSACSAQTEYWFGEEGKRSVQGNDNFYLGPGESIARDISLIIPSGIYGVKTLFLEMECNESSILASRVIEITTSFPAIPQLGVLQIEEEWENPLEFSYTIESSGEEKAAFYIEEQLVKDGNVVWANAQNIAVTGSSQIKRIGPILPPGNYKLTVGASRGAESARIAREFSIKSPVPPVPVLPLAALGLVALVAAFAAVRYFTSKTKFSGKATFFDETGTEVGRILPTSEALCLVESDSNGVLDEDLLDKTLNLAGLRGRKKLVAAEFAGVTNVKQVVKGCVMANKKGKGRFETRIEIVITNNSDMNWTNVSAIAGLPKFLGLKISGLEADVKLEAVKDKKIIRFDIEKLGAMHSASILYRIPMLVSQEEANSIPLPAIIGYEESEPLVITQIKVERKAEPVERTAVKVVEIKQMAKKKARKKKRPAKKQEKN